MSVSVTRKGDSRFRRTGSENFHLIFIRPIFPQNWTRLFKIQITKKEKLNQGKILYSITVTSSVKITATLPEGIIFPHFKISIR